jgi:ribosomal protein L37AE/L43A
MIHSQEKDKLTLMMMISLSDVMYCPKCAKRLSSLATLNHWECTNCGLKLEQLTIFETEENENETKRISKTSTTNT